MSYLHRLKKSGIILFVCACLCFAALPVRATEEKNTENQSNTSVRNDSQDNYLNYIASFSGDSHPNTVCTVDIGEYTNMSNAVVSKTTDGLCWENAEGWIEWNFSIEQVGLYCLEFEYIPTQENGKSIELELQIDGALPFSEAQCIVLPHRFKDENETPETDLMGNDIVPSQIETGGKCKWTVVDNQGFIAGSLSFMLTQGTHTLRLSALKESFVLSGIRFYNDEETPDYKTYIQQVPSTAETGENLVFEAEKAIEKTSPMLYPLVDRSSPSTTPSDPICKKMNTIGGDNWNTPVQELVWEIDVPKDGLYTISFRYKQNFLRGLFVSRVLRIDGKIPFSELEDIRFDYSVRWQTKTLGDDKPYQIYFTAGKHRLSMTPTIGVLEEIVADANEVVSSLNTLYRRIIMVTGTSPDMFRDYYLQDAIPDLIEELTTCAKSLRNIDQMIYDLTGKNGSESAILARIADQLEDFIRRPNTIPERLEAFRNNIITASSWALTIQGQSLTLDKFWVCPAGNEPEISSASFWQSFGYHLKAFFGSFVVDYESVGQTSDTAEVSISVWTSTGRDQAEVLKKLIDSKFTPSGGINVNLSLVQGGLMQAFMSGKAPDVALSMGRGDPLNYALRGAVCALEELEGFEELRSNYTPTAFDPFYLDGHCYAVPETENFLMLFYRTDVFEELGLTAPNTWDDMLDVAEKIQRNNMNIGLPYASLDAYAVVSQGIGSQTIYPTLLLQNGNGLYSDDFKSTKFDTTVAIDAFKSWCDYYTQYNFPLYKDDFNRFRTGEMPLAITGYTFYNQLMTAAPEIRNLWEMYLLPGTLKEDGTVDRTTASSGTASMILKSVKNLDAAWEFVKWFNSSEIQGQYGVEIENVVGAAGRYNPANINAISFLPWSSKELKLITDQMKYVVDLHEIPGGYYVSRNLDNAFKAVYYDNENYREALSYWNKQINREIERKRSEFGLDN